MRSSDILVVHQRRDWDSAIQRLLDLPDTDFPSWRVSHRGTFLLMSLPAYWRWDEIWSEDGVLLYSGYDRDAAMSLINPTNYCSLFSAHIE